MDGTSARQALALPHDKAVSDVVLPGPVHLGRQEWPDASPERAPDIYGSILWKRKGVMLATALAGVLIAVGIGLVQKPVYRARASVEVNSFNDTFLSLRDVAPTSTNSAADAYVQTQVRLLQSQGVMLRVIDRLKLRDRRVAEPTGRIGIWIKSAADWLHSVPVAQLKPLTPDDELLQRLSSMLVVRPLPGSRLIEVFFDSNDPKFAKDALDAVIAEYIDQNIAARLAETQKTQDWLGRQTRDLEGKLKESSQLLQSYVKDSGILIPSGKEKESPAEERFRQVQAELSRAQGERILKQSLYETATTTPLESLPALLNSGPLREYQLNLAELRRQQAQLSSSLTPAHYKMERIAAQIAEVEKALQKEWSKTLTLIRNDYEAAMKREKLLADQWTTQARVVSDQSAKAVRYDVLRRETDSRQRLYDTVLQKLHEATVASALNSTNIRVVDFPGLPASPYRPRLMMNAGIGLLAGSLLGLLIGLIRLRSDQRCVTPASVDAYLPVRELGVIPSASVETRDVFGDPRRFVSLKAHEQVELVTWQHKPSLLADSFRGSLVSLLHSYTNGDRPKVSTVTSPNSQEGKTTVTSNLGIALAETGRRVLLIDADLRAPRLSSVFEVPNDWGLSDILLSNDGIDAMPLESIVKPTTVPGLSLLPSGPSASSVTSLFYSERLSKLLTRFRQEFDTVLIDAPPVGVFPEARLIGQCSDGVILVTRSHRTSLDSYRAACETFMQDRIPVLGTIVNDWNPKRSGIKFKDYYRDYYHR